MREREIETIDESTGEVVSRTVEKACEGQVYERKNNSLSVVDAVEKRIAEKKKVSFYVFISATVILAMALAYVVFVI